jgi:hypothetical protein
VLRGAAEWKTNNIEELYVVIARMTDEDGTFSLRVGRGSEAGGAGLTNKQNRQSVTATLAVYIANTLTLLVFRFVFVLFSQKATN